MPDKSSMGRKLRVCQELRQLPKLALRRQAVGEWSCSGMNDGLVP